MKKTFLLSILLGIIALTSWILVQGIFKIGNQPSTDRVSSTISNQNSGSNIHQTNSPPEQLLNIQNGFHLLPPEGWNRESVLEGAINVVAYGSPAYIVNFTNPISLSDALPSAIMVSTFTIDSRLTARDVANLIHKRRIADKLQSGTTECLFSAPIYTIGDLDTFSYTEDNTNLGICVSEGTEIGIIETVVAKKIGQTNSLVASFVVSTKEEYIRYYGMFFEMLSSINFSQN